MTAIPLSQLATSRHWQKNFLAVLPAVKTHASVSFRHLHAEARADAAAETVAHAFVDYGRLHRRHRLGHAYPASLATYAVKAVRAQRRVGGHLNAQDILNRVAQKKHHITVASLTPWNAAEGAWREMAVESKRVSPAETACFRLDFHTWLRSWPDRHRRIIQALASGDRTMSVAERFGISQARISQLRREYERSWMQFQGMAWAA